MFTSFCPICFCLSVSHCLSKKTFVCTNMRLFTSTQAQRHTHTKRPYIASIRVNFSYHVLIKQHQAQQQSSDFSYCGILTVCNCTKYKLRCYLFCPTNYHVNSTCTSWSVTNHVTFFSLSVLCRCVSVIQFIHK